MATDLPWVYPLAAERVVVGPHFGDGEELELSMSSMFAAQFGLAEARCGCSGLMFIHALTLDL
jgi:hypothetical protein